MNIDRRGLLRLFSTGAVVAPFADGVPIIDAAAKLIEEPKVELIEATALPNPSDTSIHDFIYTAQMNRVKVTLEHSHFRFDGFAYLTEWNVDAPVHGADYLMAERPQTLRNLPGMVRTSVKLQFTERPSMVKLK